MTIRTLLRAAVYLIAGAAIVDPGLPKTTLSPVPVEVRASDSGSEPRAAEVRQRLDSSLKSSMDLNPLERPAAVVLVGDRPGAEPWPDNVPISTVGNPPPPAPNVRIVDARDPQPVLPGWSAAVSVVVEGTGVVGKTTDVALEQSGVEIQKVSHTWTQATERFAAHLTCPVPEAGVAILTVRAKPTAGEVVLEDNVVHLRAVAEARVLRIAAYDPRPSWTSAFVRRLLEPDPTFEVSTVVEASKGLDVRAGHPAAGITAQALEPFDVVLVGAPEELTTNVSDALSRYARERGGAVVLLPDRRPSGPFAALLGSPGFDEVLLDKAVELEVPAGLRLRGSEFALPKTAGAATVLAAVRQGSSTRPAVFSMPAGRGQIIFSGALDAWRFRGSDGEAYAGFWRRLVAVAAIAAPRRLEVSVHPAVAAPGTPISVRADVRRTEIERQGRRRTIPPIEASVIGPNGSAASVRLWPAAEVGVYEGRFDAGGPGQYDVRGSLDGRGIADTPLVIRNYARTLEPRDDEGRRLIAQVTGGIATSADNLQPLEAHLARLPRVTASTHLHVTRSPWWMAAFVALLCGEWTLRRRRGER